MVLDMSYTIRKYKFKRWETPQIELTDETTIIDDRFIFAIDTLQLLNKFRLRNEANITLPVPLIYNPRRKLFEIGERLFYLWNFKDYLALAVTIPAESTKTIVDIKGEGLIYWLWIKGDYPELEFKFYHQGRNVFYATFKELYEWGFENADTPISLLIYDTTNNSYALQLKRIMPIQGRFVVQCDNPDTSDHLLARISLWCFEKPGTTLNASVG